MIEYFYLFDYGSQLSETSKNTAASPTPASKSFLIEHAKVFAMAVKYQADGLRELAAIKFRNAATTLWEHDDLPTAISTVYASTTDDVLELRLVVEDVLHDHFDVLKANEEFAAVTRGIPGLAYALLSRRPGKDHRLDKDCDARSCASTYTNLCPGCRKQSRYCKRCREVDGYWRCSFCNHRND